MEPVPISAPEPLDEAVPATQGELIVQNGRLRGTRRALASPLTLIGRDQSCEFHLNVDGVKPLHCAIVQSSTGFHLRNLGGDAATLVNGEAVQESRLHDGDVLTVGPFQFSVHLSEEGEPDSDGALQAERDALRIQAAAVAAQQADLAEQEAQLQQRRKALERQQDQLAAHLEERRQQLLELREQARKDRAAIKADTEAARRQNEEVRAALSKEREAVQQELQQAGKERRRLNELRKRLRKRWRKHWQAHEADLERGAQELKARKANLEREAEKLQRERVQLMQAQLRFNGEVELGRRQLQDEWQQLGLQQQQWEACLNQEQTEHSVRLRQLNCREIKLAETEQKLSEQRRLMEQFHLHLRKEAEGLEARIRNQRLKLLEYEKQLSEAASKRQAASKDCEVPAPAILVVRPQQADVPRALEQLAADLADQRRHLLEQWQCLLALYDAWEPERSAVVAQFEKAARELVLIERRLEGREQALAAGETDLCRHHQALFEVRCSLEAWQTRLTARETFLDNERVMLLADMRAGEERTESQMKRLEEMRQRRARRRGQEIEELGVARAQHEQMRRDYVLLWQECQDRRAELIRQQRELAAKSLAVEQLRQELLGRTDDTPRADKRLERLRRRNLARLQEEERDLKRERAALMGETKRLHCRGARLLRQEEALLDRHEEWMKQVADWEEQQAAAAALEQHRQQELQRWQLLHERDELQLIALREEVERIARMLLEEGESMSAPLAA
ncbi:MAG: FHA domain-containing protein [Gemmataceae bacterium]